MADARTRALSELAEVLGVDPGADLLDLALTHRSYAYEHGGLPTNERLEFLGDSVLGLAVTELLFRSYPDRPESDLARLRAAVVSTRALAGVARTLGPSGLGAYVLLGRGETQTGGADKDSILADSLEAVFGAVFLGCGHGAAETLVRRLLRDRIEAAESGRGGTDWKTALQEAVAAIGLPAVSYRVTSEGPDHRKEFVAAALVDGSERGRGTGRSKKESEQAAARAALEALGRPPGPVGPGQRDAPEAAPVGSP